MAKSRNNRARRRIIALVGASARIAQAQRASSEEMK